MSYQESSSKGVTEFHPAPLTCTIDGLAHLVSDDAAAEGIAAGRGIYVALCGHHVHAAALICSTGKPCPGCTAQVRRLSASDEHARSVRRVWQEWLRRLFGRPRIESRTT